MNDIEYCNFIIEGLTTRMQVALRQNWLHDEWQEWCMQSLQWIHENAAKRNTNKTSGNVTQLHPLTNMDMPPDKVLNGAIDRLNDVCVIGYDKEGSEYFAASTGDLQKALWLAERFKYFLMRTQDD